MGAWDATVFGNDWAADFSGDLADAADLNQIKNQLREAMLDALNESGNLDSMYGSYAAAAAALVAAWDTPDLIAGNSYTPDVWPPQAGGPAPDDLKQLARQTFARVTSEADNELSEGWIEAESWDEFKTDIARYHSALS